MASERPPEPWDSFLSEIDTDLHEPVSLYCLGAFVIAMLYGLPRRTDDVDYITVIPLREISHLESCAGRGSTLHRRYGVYLQHTAVVTVPENYLERVKAIYAGAYRFLRLFGLDPYDLALSKLERNLPRDRDDVRFMMRNVPLNFAILEERYRAELRPYLANQERHDLTLDLWRDMIAPIGA